jgi:hypothetical protein
MRFTNPGLVIASPTASELPGPSFRKAPTPAARLRDLSVTFRQTSLKLKNELKNPERTNLTPAVFSR